MRMFILVCPLLGQHKGNTLRHWSLIHQYSHIIQIDVHNHCRPIVLPFLSSLQSLLDWLSPLFLSPRLAALFTMF